MPNPDIEKQLICLACVRRHMSKESIERECRIHDRNARIAAAARWYVECSRLYETLIEYHIKPPFNPNGFDEILNIYLQARAALKQAVKGGLNE